MGTSSPGHDSCFGARFGAPLGSARPFTPAYVARCVGATAIRRPSGAAAAWRDLRVR